MFALFDAELFNSINLKCDPEKALELREKYSAVKAGYHMNKKYWNTIEMDNRISEKLILEMIDDSYALVVQGLTKKEKAKLSL